MTTTVQPATRDELRLAVTEEARQKVLDLMEEQGIHDVALRVAVTGGGCSGFQYRFDFEEEPGSHDLVVDAGGFRLFVDRISAGYLAGSELDYVSSLMSEGFHIRNPNATGTCGCGLSVSF